MAATLESVLSHVFPFSKIKHRHFIGHPRYFYLCLQGPRGMETGKEYGKRICTSWLWDFPAFFSPPFSCSIRYQEWKRASEKKKKKKTERMEGALVSTFFPVSKLSESKNGLLIFSDTGLEMDFLNHKMKKLSLAFMYLQQSSPISN